MADAEAATIGFGGVYIRVKRWALRRYLSACLTSRPAASLSVSAMRAGCGDRAGCLCSDPKSLNRYRRLEF
eukprot:2649144-Rhodomonas_salina.2